MEDVVLLRETDGCCGEMQTVLCNATDTFQVDVSVDNEFLVSFSYSTRERIGVRNGLTARVKEVTEVSLTLNNFLIEITYPAVCRSVLITCSNGELSNSKEFFVNSESSRHQLNVCPSFHLWSINLQVRNV